MRPAFWSVDQNAGLFFFFVEIGGGNLPKPLFIGNEDGSTINVQQNRIRKKGCALSARERVLAIRLLEKTAKHSEYVKGLGIEVVISKVDSKGKRL